MPVTSKRDCEGVIAKNRCYVRKPGPRSEDPLTSNEWRDLLNRCLRAGRDDMLEAIRSIVAGKVVSPLAAPDQQAAFAEFIRGGRDRWAELVADLPPDEPGRFPHGH